MTKAELVTLAKRVSIAEEVYRGLSFANTPLDYEKRVEFDAKYKIAQSAWWKAQSEYSAAIADLSAVELEEIMREATP